jgi:hypothetical protein
MMAAGLLQLQQHLPAMVGFALLLALPLTLLLSWGVLGFYQRALLRWMRRNPPPALAAPGPLTPAPPPPPAAPLPPLALALLWLLIGLSATLLYLPVHGLAISPFRVLAVGLVLAAPGWLQLGLMARLPWRRGLALVLAGFAGLFVVIVPLLVDTSGQALLQLLKYLLITGLLPGAALTLLIGIPSLRASAPLLYGPVAGLTLLATLGQPLLMGALATILFELFPSVWRLWPVPLGIGVDALPVLALLPPLLAGALAPYADGGLITWLVRRGLVKPSGDTPLKIGFEGTVNLPPVSFAHQDDWAQWFAEIQEAVVRLRTPLWPQQVFGASNPQLLHQGQALFGAHCASCHLPSSWRASTTTPPWWPTPNCSTPGACPTVLTWHATTTARRVLPTCTTARCAP